ncbi:MAG: STAS domain-containing protein [Streptosporangiaceae bacterium]
MSGEHYPVLWIGRTAVVSLPAEIDITNADQVREDLLSVLNRGAALLIADLSTTTFCDSAGVSALARSFRRAEASQSDMRLVVTTMAVQRVLTLTGIDRLLDIYPSVAASLAGSPDDQKAQAHARAARQPRRIVCRGRHHCRIAIQISRPGRAWKGGSLCSS